MLPGYDLRYVKETSRLRVFNTRAASVENDMQALKELFTSDVGLLSLAVIVVVIGMGIYFVRFFQKQMQESERTASGR